MRVKKTIVNWLIKIHKRYPMFILVFFMKDVSNFLFQTMLMDYATLIKWNFWKQDNGKTVVVVGKR